MSGMSTTNTVGINKCLSFVSWVQTLEFAKEAEIMALSRVTKLEDLVITSSPRTSASMYLVVVSLARAISQSVTHSVQKALESVIMQSNSRFFFKTARLALVLRKVVAKASAKPGSF